MNPEIRWFVTSLVLALLLCAGAIGWAWVSDRREDAARRRDEPEEDE